MVLIHDSAGCVNKKVGTVLSQPAARSDKTKPGGASRLLLSVEQAQKFDSSCKNCGSSYNYKLN